jgi:hypothetical protein
VQLKRFIFLKEAKHGEYHWIFTSVRCCGNIVEVCMQAWVRLACCGQPMKLIGENTTDAAREKTWCRLSKKVAGGIKVSVGSVPQS